MICLHRILLSNPYWHGFDHSSYMTFNGREVFVIVIGI